MSAPARPTPLSLRSSEALHSTGGPYAWCVLGVLVVVYIFNFIDRQILSILAERIKANLQLGDAQLGFLLWSGAAVSTIQDLALPRMRAIASAAYLLAVTFLGLALGPYAIGRLSGALGSLRAGMLYGLCINAFALLCGALASRHLARDESSKLERARRAGEPNL